MMFRKGEEEVVVWIYITCADFVYAAWILVKTKIMNVKLLEKLQKKLRETNISENKLIRASH